MTCNCLILYATILILSLEFLRCSGDCQGISSMSQSIYPQGLILVPYNPQFATEHLLYCVDETYNAEELEFRLSHYSSIPWYKVNTTTIALRINETEKGVFVYYCSNKVTKKICVTRVLVDSAPLPVTDFACTSYNFEVLNCSWTNPDTYTVINYTLAMTWDDDHPYITCNPSRIGKTRFCAWSTRSYPRYRQLEKQFNFNLKLSNVFGTNEQNYTINHSSIVKPDPPRNLKVIGNGTHSVNLQWSIPNNMVDFLPKSGLEHKIEYQISKIDNSYFYTVNTSELPPHNRTYKFLLKDLPYSNMQYTVRIYIRPKEAVKDEYWSDFTYVVFKTKSETSNIPETYSFPDTSKHDSCDTSKGIYYGFPIKVDHGAVGKSSVKVTWTMTCKIQEGIVTGYLITYCPVKDTRNVCDPSFGKSKIKILDPQQMEITITDLKPLTSYQINLSVNTIYGEKFIENGLIKVTAFNKKYLHLRTRK